MSVITEYLVIEDILTELFGNLPDVVNENGTFPITFKYGDEDELNAYLANNSNAGNTIYPLIWLVYPFLETHTRNFVDTPNLELILAVQGSANLYSEERMEQTFKGVLIPLYNNIHKIFNRSYVIDTENEYEVTKFPNYSVILDEETEQTVIDRWDALKVSFSAKFNNNCIKPITL